MLIPILLYSVVSQAEPEQLPKFSRPHARHQPLTRNQFQIAFFINEQSALFFMGPEAIFFDPDVVGDVAVSDAVHGVDLLHLMYLLYHFRDDLSIGFLQVFQIIFVLGFNIS